MYCLYMITADQLKSCACACEYVATMHCVFLYTSNRAAAVCNGCDILRVARSAMITIWVARFGLGVTGHGLILRGPPALIMRPVMSDNNHLMEKRRGSSHFLDHFHQLDDCYLLLYKSESLQIFNCV